MSAVIIIAGYLVKTLAASIPDFQSWQNLTQFYYYNDHAPLLNGFNAGNAAVLAGAALLLLGVAVAGFIRRDLAV